MKIHLFIAEDGDFIPVTEENGCYETICRAALDSNYTVRSEGSMAGMTDRIEIREKRYRRFTVAIPDEIWTQFTSCERARQHLIGAVICELEARGDAPWKRTTVSVE